MEVCDDAGLAVGSPIVHGARGGDERPSEEDFLDARHVRRAGIDERDIVEPADSEFSDRVHGVYYTIFQEVWEVPRWEVLGSFGRVGRFGRGEKS